MKINAKEFEKFVREHASDFEITVPRPGVYRFRVTIDFYAGGKPCSQHITSLTGVE